MSNLYLTQFLILICLFNIISSYLKFNIPSDQDKCFSEELYVAGTLLIKYDLTGFEKDFNEEEQKNLFKDIKVFIKNEHNKNLYETELKSRKEKFVYTVKEPGHYQVCARYIKPRRGRELSKNILMALKIRSDYDYKEFKEVLMREDVDKFWNNILTLKREMRPSIEAGQIEISEEDKTAKRIISSVNVYYKLCVIQLAIVIILNISILVSYQDFFKKKSII